MHADVGIVIFNYETYLPRCVGDWGALRHSLPLRPTVAILSCVEIVSFTMDLNSRGSAFAYPVGICVRLTLATMNRGRSVRCYFGMLYVAL
jgi:hypothetical protein